MHPSVILTIETEQVPVLENKELALPPPHHSTLPAKPSSKFFAQNELQSWFFHPTRTVQCRQFQYCAMFNDKNTHAHMHTNTHTHTHAHKHARTHSHTCMRAHMHAYTHTWAHTSTHARTHTHTQCEQLNIKQIVNMTVLITTTS